MRYFLLLMLLAVVSLGTAQTLWLVGEGVEINVPKVAEIVRVTLDEPVNVITNKNESLIAWAYNPKTAKTRQELLAKATCVLVSLGAQDNDALNLMTLLAIDKQRPRGARRLMVIADQKPVYKMNGLCDRTRLMRTANLAFGANCDLIALPKVWQRVYTDDTFYEERITKGADAENYIQAATILLSIKGEKFPLPPLKGYATERTDRLIQSIRNGFTLSKDINYAVQHMSVKQFDLRQGDSFSAVLYDGKFEHAIGEWLLQFAKADQRKLNLLYTSDTTLSTELPGLFRANQSMSNAPNVNRYTRPVFADDTGLSEIENLEILLSHDANITGYIPFPLAVAEFIRRFPGEPVYQGVIPQNATAAMFAAMLWIEWTGAAVLPPNCDPITAQAISIGLETQLQMKTLRKNVNAVLCRPVSKNRYLFSLWRRPSQNVRLQIAVSNNGDCTPDVLDFDSKNFWAQQEVAVTLPPMKNKTTSLLWKVKGPFVGQSTGARKFE
ncbi:MAG: hypothetical protein RR417_00935 [Kiritimatiellia bacterium]